LEKKTSSTSPVRLIEIGPEQQGQRIDNFLIKTLKSVPRTRVYRIIRKGEVRVNKKRVKPEYKLCLGDSVRVPPVRSEGSEQDEVTLPGDLVALIEKSILFENESIVIVNKPAGLAVHSGSGVRFGLIDVMRQLRANSPIELVHRLDRDTSGCVMLAKGREALLSMQSLLRSDELRKHYIAIVKGHWPVKLTQIDSRLKRVTMPNGEKRVFVDPAGQSAETLIESVVHGKRGELLFSQVEILLKTGRTHQIRVHCQSVGHSIGGDAKYGDRDFDRLLRHAGCKRLLLHANRLELPQTAHTQAIEVVAPRPAEFDLLP
jgi:23S rRNA pseudouridine955/2504/2580 synthase